MTIKALYPTVRPTLNLDFAKTKVLDPRVTFTRASTATFVGANGLIQTAASGAARFDHNPTTGESLGLLVEEARTNNCVRSEEISSGSWSKLDGANVVSVTVAADAAMSPAGTLTADTVIPTTNNGPHYITQFVLAAGQTYSVFVKPAGYNFIAVADGSNTFSARFDLVNGTATVLNGSVTAGIAALSNGWFRIFGTVTSNTNDQFRIYVLSSASGIGDFFVGDGTSGVHVWGAQVEAGSFPTSYIPTTTATVTRAADVASMTGTNFSSINYNQLAGTAVFTGAPFFNNTTNFWRSYFAFTESTTVGLDGLRPMQYTNTSIQITANQYGGSYILTIDAPTPVNGSTRKLAVSHAKGTGITACFNGGSIQSRSTNEPYTFTQDRLVIAGPGYLGAAYSGTIARLAYYPVKLPDAQLQALTAT